MTTSRSAAFRAMGCSGSVLVTGAPDPALVERAIGRIGELESRWSRFLDQSEISTLNAAGGRPCQVSDDTIQLVEALVRAWHATAGSFDPTLLVPLVRLGYAASRDDATQRTSLAAGAAPSGRPADVLVDHERGLVALPVGTVLDPGGLGKGLAADIVVTELLAAGATGAIVEIGGDLRVGGQPDDGEAGWTIGIDTALEAGDVVSLVDGGVATSTSRFRTWTVGGATHHHLLDPNTGRSSAHPTVSCTVVAGTAAWAEAFTKVAFAMAPGDALSRLDERSLAASITTADGTRMTTSAWKEFAR